MIIFHSLVDFTDGVAEAIDSTNHDHAAGVGSTRALARPDFAVEENLAVFYPAFEVELPMSAHADERKPLADNLADPRVFAMFDFGG